MIRMARCLAPPTQSRNWRTSSGLRTTAEFAVLRRRDDVLEGPLLLEGDLVEEAQCRDCDEDGAGRQLFLVGQINLVGADVLRTQLFWRFVEVAREQGHLLHVGQSACSRRDSAPACLRSCVAEGMSWKAPLRNGMCCKQPLHAFAREFSEKGGEWIRQRGLFALKCWCHANTAQRFSPMPTNGSVMGGLVPNQPERCADEEGARARVQLSTRRSRLECRQAPEAMSTRLGHWPKGAK